MIILDTNILSEMMRPQPNVQVIHWLNQQPNESLFITSITLAELNFGIEALVESKRKQALKSLLDEILLLFEGRVLPFDEKAATHYGNLAAKARKNGHGFPIADGYIAAIATAKKFKIATRDDSAFKAARLTVINPWSMES